MERKKFDTNVFFSGGAGMFLEYHDIVKPAWLYAVINLIISKYQGLPVNIIGNMPLICILEWYLNRSYRNPLKCLDWKNEIPLDELDALMKDILKDKSIYRLAPTLQIGIFLEIYKNESMDFPFIIYSDEYEEGIEEDLKNVFKGVKYKYVYGSLQEAIKMCSDNFTYIFSSVDKVPIAAKELFGTCSHVLLSEDYLYNFTDYRKTMKVDLKKIMREHPFIRTGTTRVFDINMIGKSFMNVSKGGE